jgi:hypothetical protein
MESKLKPIMQMVNPKYLNEKGIVLEGFSYYDTRSRMFNIIRLPAFLKHFFTDIKRQKLKFEIRCFSDMKHLKEYLETSKEVPMLLNLYEREDPTSSIEIK